jgi:hypothetical protein
MHVDAQRISPELIDAISGDVVVVPIRRRPVERMKGDLFAKA